MIFQKSSSRRGEVKALRVGRSAWELKIDPKRLREEIKNVIEKRRKKRHEKKSINSNKKRLKKLWHRLAREQGEAREKVGRAVWSPEAPRSAHTRGLINDKNNNGTDFIDFNNNNQRFTLSNTLVAQRARRISPTWNPLTRMMIPMTHVTSSWQPR